MKQNVKVYLLFCSSNLNNLQYLETQYLTPEQAELLLTPDFRERYFNMSSEAQDAVLKLFSCLDYKEKQYENSLKILLTYSVDTTRIF